MRLALIVFLPMLAAWAAYPLGRKSERAAELLAVLTAAVEIFLAVSLLFTGTGQAASFDGFGLHFSAGSLQGALAVLAAFMWVMTALASPEYFCRMGALNASASSALQLSASRCTVASTEAACSPPMTEIRALGHIHRKRGEYARPHIE